MYYPIWLEKTKSADLFEKLSKHIRVRRRNKVSQLIVKTHMREIEISRITILSHGCERVVTY